MPSSKKLLLISYWAAPIQSAASNRINSFIEILEQEGWKIVLVSPSFKNRNLVDHKTLYFKNKPLPCYKRYELNGFAVDVFFKRLLKKKLPTEIVQQRSCPNHQYPLRRFIERISVNINRYFFLPDTYFWGWYFFNKKKILKIVDTEEPDIVLTSAMPISTHFFGRYIAQKRNIPWVADYRDLYVGTLGDSIKFISLIKKHIQAYLLKKVALVTTVSEGLKETLVEQSYKKTEIVYNGYTRQRKQLISLDSEALSYFGIYTGTLYPSQYASFFLFLKLLDRHKLNEKNYFIGRINEYDLCKKASALNLQHLMNKCEFKPLMSENKLLKYEQQAEYFLHFDFDIDGNLSSKIFNYFNREKPILLFTENDKSELSHIVQRAGHRVLTAKDLEKSTICLNSKSHINNSFISQFDRNFQGLKMESFLRNVLDMDYQQDNSNLHL